MEMWFDGASSEKFGGAGAVVRWDGRTQKLNKFLGVATCNEAEYEALILGLEFCAEKGPDMLYVRGDSMLVVKQMLGDWKTKKPHLKPLRDKALALVARFKDIQIAWIPREENEEADIQSKAALKDVGRYLQEPDCRRFRSLVRTTGRLTSREEVSVGQEEA